MITDYWKAAEVAGDPKVAGASPLVAESYSWLMGHRTLAH